MHERGGVVSGPARLFRRGSGAGASGSTWAIKVLSGSNGLLPERVIMGCIYEIKAHYGGRGGYATLEKGECRSREPSLRAVARTWPAARLEVPARSSFATSPSTGAGRKARYCGRNNSSTICGTGLGRLTHL